MERYIHREQGDRGRQKKIQRKTEGDRVRQIDTGRDRERHWGNER